MMASSAGSEWCVPFGRVTDGDWEAFEVASGVRHASAGAQAVEVYVLGRLLAALELRDGHVRAQVFLPLLLQDLREADVLRSRDGDVHFRPTGGVGPVLGLRREFLRLGYVEYVPISRCM